jgi:hypothetical protein
MNTLPPKDHCSSHLADKELNTRTVIRSAQHTKTKSPQYGDVQLTKWQLRLVFGRLRLGLGDDVPRKDPYLRPIWVRVVERDGEEALGDLQVIYPIQCNLGISRSKMIENRPLMLYVSSGASPAVEASVDIVAFAVKVWRGGLTRRVLGRGCGTSLRARALLASLTCRWT